MQVTLGTKNQSPRSWRWEGAWQNQVYKNRIPTTFIFCYLRGFQKRAMKQDTCEPSSSETFTIQCQHHVPCGSCIYVKCSDGRYFELPHVNIADDATEKFLDQVLAAATICRQHLANKIHMKWLTQEQWRQYNNTTNCSICAKPFKSADKKVHDHDHLTGEYRGPAHKACNLNYHIDPKKASIPCIIHNLEGIVSML